MAAPWHTMKASAHASFFLPMPTEVERKFLVRDASWRAGAVRAERYRQGYLANTPRASVRVRVAAERAWLNVKSATLDVTRDEYEYRVPLADARQMLEGLCEGAVVEKTRYFVPHGEHTWEVDVFEGDNAGLVVAEVELRDRDEVFDYPPWVGEEVSDDPRYYNVCLARHPYKAWGCR